MKISDKVYRFKIIGNYDDGVIGGVGNALDNAKTKFLICEDVIESDDSTNPNSGFRYLVLRPSYLWNATSPKNYTGKTNEAVSNLYPIRPGYSLNDEIEVVSAFDENLHRPYDLGNIAGLSSYIGGFNTASNPVMNWTAINAGTIKCYFIDLNVDARTRELTSAIVAGSTGGNGGLGVWL